MSDERISEKRYSEEEKKDAWGWLYDEFGEVPVPDKEQWRIAAYALRLGAELAELRRLTPHWREMADGATHWDGCYLEHRPCALRKIEALRASHAELVKALDALMDLFHDPSPFYIKKLGSPITNGDQDKIDDTFVAAQDALEAARKVGA